MSITPRSAPIDAAAKVQSCPAFLEKLYEILSDSSNEPYIAWRPDGTAFLIKKVSEVQEIVLPKYFKHSNLQSFVRQLNMYNFAKTCHDPTYREFRNAYFIRGRRDLLTLIRRKAQPSVRETGSSSAYTGPLSGGRCANTQPGSTDIDDEGELADDTGVNGSRASQRKRTSTYKVAQSTYTNTRSQPSTRDADPGEHWEDTFSAGGSGFDDSAYVMQQSHDDYSTLVATTDDLRWRIRQLETTNTLLMDRYTGLANKHDELCTLLHKLLLAQSSEQSASLRDTLQESPPLSVSLVALLDARVNLIDATVRRRRAYSDISTGGAESVQTVESSTISAGSVRGPGDRRGVGSFDSTGSKFPDTDSDHASESDGMSGLKKASPADDKKTTPENEVNDISCMVAKSPNDSYETSSITMADICDSPTFQAANILVHNIHSSQGPTKDNGLSSFVEAISCMWHSKNSNSTSIGLNKHSQLNALSGSSNIHRVSVQPASSAPFGFSALASPIQVPRPIHANKGLVQSPLADHCVGVGGGYGNLAGKPLSKQSMPLSLDFNSIASKKQKTAHDEQSPSHIRDKHAVDAVAAGGKPAGAGDRITRQNSV